MTNTEYLKYAAARDLINLNAIVEGAVKHADNWTADAAITGATDPLKAILEAIAATGTVGAGVGAVGGSLIPGKHHGRNALIGAGVGGVLGASVLPGLGLAGLIAKANGG